LVAGGVLALVFEGGDVVGGVVGLVVEGGGEAGAFGLL
jgi:hypothetical protein